MSIKLDSSSLPKLQKIELDGLEGFEVFVAYYKAFSRLMNLFIAEGTIGAFEPMLRMFSQTTNYFEKCLNENEAFTEDVDDYIDGMKWVFEECAPDGYVFNGTEYVLDG
jgi:hypothetical protein